MCDCKRHWDNSQHCTCQCPHVLPDEQCMHIYEGYRCQRPAVWHGICAVHAAQELSAPITTTEGTDHGNVPTSAL